MFDDVPIRELQIRADKSIRYVVTSDMPLDVAQKFMHDVCPCAAPSIPNENAFFAHDWERWCRRQEDTELNALADARENDTVVKVNLDDI